jgi:hypothetical protein
MWMVYILYKDGHYTLVSYGACLFSLFCCALVRKRKKSQKSHQRLCFQETPLHSSAPFSTKMQESRNTVRIVILTSAAALQRASVKHENKQAHYTI